MMKTTEKRKCGSILKIAVSCVQVKNSMTNGRSGGAPKFEMGVLGSWSKSKRRARWFGTNATRLPISSSLALLPSIN
jgi:hypothetical protein